MVVGKTWRSSPADSAIRGISRWTAASIGWEPTTIRRPAIEFLCRSLEHILVGTIRGAVTGHPIRMPRPRQSVVRCSRDQERALSIVNHRSFLPNIVTHFWSMIGCLRKRTFGVRGGTGLCFGPREAASSHLSRAVRRFFAPLTWSLVPTAHCGFLVGAVAMVPSGRTGSWPTKAASSASLGKMHLRQPS